MKTAVLYHTSSSDQGTFSSLLLPNFKTIFMTELPWRDNKPNYSRIPPGEYVAKWHKSPRFGECWWLQDVPGRSEVLIHPGNFAGDRLKGFKTHSYGCLLPSKYRGRIGDQLAGLSSRPALRMMKDAIGPNNFILKIMEPESWNG